MKIYAEKPYFTRRRLFPAFLNATQKKAQIENGLVDGSLKCPKETYSRSPKEPIGCS